MTFHVGSQCRNPENWRVALEKARSLFDLMTKAGLKPRLLNIGGGYPVRHVKPIPSIEVIGEVVNEGLKAFPDDVQVIAEPGRYLVSDAGYFVCRVLGTATRAGKRWMHWDAGLFGGVIESSEGLKYRIRTDRSGPDVAWTVGGPTCDSVDIVMRDEPLPSDLQEGDFIYIRNAGAYTTAYASQFNGFPLPEVRVFESKKQARPFRSVRKARSRTSSRPPRYAASRWVSLQCERSYGGNQVSPSKSRVDFGHHQAGRDRQRLGEKAAAADHERHRLAERIAPAPPPASSPPPRPAPRIRRCA